ncbi:hypothetical protein HX109_15560 [Galbibacter sp. BG1]|uniref:hypothetical protein n=1 Tax=Galbibacter sp. BG1 TaxID=1170699 RepID=UPI0015B89970|nr:hypothetical protein [Galbibacter sp. BG1]QLE02916.1 hypothetical protein HX109_15560 [Galbibacter sp. BG1]
MKNLAVVLAFIASVVFYNSVEAQVDFPKADFLKTMNDFDKDELDLSEEQSSELKDLNSDMVSSVSNILNSDKDKEKKIADLTNLKSNTSKKGKDILGEDKFKKYKKSMKKKLKPFTRKTKLLKFAL